MPWDDWMQRCLASSREQIGTEWLDYFLTSPIFRFVISPGCLDNSSWAGIMVPSVDSVGRYFPLTIASPLSSETDIYQFLSSNVNWYKNLEGVAMQCLQQGISADETIALLSGVEIFHEENLAKIQRSTNGVIVQTPSPELEMSFAALIQAQTNGTHSLDSQSLWWTGASTERCSQLHNCRGMPSPNQFSMMICGKLEEVPA